MSQNEALAFAEPYDHEFWIDSNQLPKIFKQNANLRLKNVLPLKQLDNKNMLPIKQLYGTKTVGKFGVVSKFLKKS